MVAAMIMDIHMLNPTTTPIIGETSINWKIAKTPNNNPYKIPNISPTLISLNKILTEFSILTLPVANPLTIIVEDWVPILPPIPIITGIKAANAMVLFNTSSKTPIIKAAKIPPTQLANNQGTLIRAFSHDDLRRISRSFPAPTNCKKSSVASSRITSTTSSTVTIPKSRSSWSTTGTAKKLYCDTIRATSSWSVSGRTTCICLDIISFSIVSPSVYIKIPALSSG